MDSNVQKIANLINLLQCNMDIRTFNFKHVKKYMKSVVVENERFCVIILNYRLKNTKTLNMYVCVSPTRKK